MITFELKVFINNISSFKGNHHESIHLMYQLLYGRASFKLTTSQRTRVIYQIVNLLINMEDLITAVAVLTSLAESLNDNAEVWSSVGRLHVQLGNLPAVKTTFAKVEELLSGSETRADLVLTNRALMLITAGDFAGAMTQLTDLVSRYPADCTAMNNLGVCQLLAGNVGQAAAFLENLVIDSPGKAGVCEPLLFNLASMV